MKAIKVDIVTETVDINPQQMVQKYAKLTPISVAKYGDTIPQLAPQEIYTYHPKHVFNHNGELCLYLVQESDKNIFEDLITITADDFDKLRKDIKYQYYKEHKPSDEFLRHYFKETLELEIEKAKESWDKSRNYDNENFVRWVHAKAEVDSDGILSLLSKTLFGNNKK